MSGKAAAQQYVPGQAGRAAWQFPRRERANAVNERRERP